MLFVDLIALAAEPSPYPLPGYREREEGKLQLPRRTSVMQVQLTLREVVCVIVGGVQGVVIQTVEDGGGQPPSRLLPSTSGWLRTITSTSTAAFLWMAE